MKLYVCMVLGGSIGTLLYILFNLVLPYEFGLKWKNIFIRVNVLFYLLPLPLVMTRLKGNLKEMMGKAGIHFPPEKLPDVMSTKNVWNSIIIRNVDGKILYITGYQKLLPVIELMSGIFCILTIGWVVAYLLICHYYKKDISKLNTEQCFDNIKDRKRIHISVSAHITSPVTIGLMKPIILIPADGGNYEAAMDGIVRHELRHIENLDILFRFLTFVVVAVQWYNPLAYYLLRENMAVSEMLCDEAATGGMSKEEKTCYMRCMIDAVEKSKAAETMIMTLGASKGLSKRRMKRIMGRNKKKIWRKGFATGIIIFCFIVSSIPALAYKEPVKHDFDTDIASKDWSNVNYVTFTLEGTGKDEVEIIKLGLYDGVFVNEAGETWFYDHSELNSESQMSEACQHTYQAGAYSDHHVKSEDGCVLITYNAERCFKCGYLKIGSKNETHIYENCPH